MSEETRRQMAAAEATVRAYRLKTDEQRRWEAEMQSLLRSASALLQAHVAASSLMVLAPLVAACQPTGCRS